MTETVYGTAPMSGSLHIDVRAAVVHVTGGHVCEATGCRHVGLLASLC